MFWKNSKKKNDQGPAQPSKSIADLLVQLETNPDFNHFCHKSKTLTCWISYINTVVDLEYIHRDLLPALYSERVQCMKDIAQVVPIDKLIETRDLSVIQTSLLDGYFMIQPSKRSQHVYLIPCPKKQARQVADTEVETSIVGAHDSFVESLETNINLVRSRIPIPQFKVEEQRIGKLSRTRISILYIEGLANKANLNTTRQRITDLETVSVINANMLALMIGDNSQSFFPQFIDTERPDRVSGALYEGKIAVLVDGSPSALILPSTIVEFFSTIDDYSLNWPIASLYRLLRLFAVAFSVISSSLYVAALTYHYQLVPKDLLATLIVSRSSVPYDPIIEVLLLEVMIELLREAGVRLPTKVGQTIGIVGGIVIGTASVQAGVTSNILLIIIAMSALAAFITPNYRMATTIRLMRFPFILAAQMFGLIGVGLCFMFFVCHLLKLTSLGRPFIEPIYPMRVTDLKDSFIRLPSNMQGQRPLFLRTADKNRVNLHRTMQKKGKAKPDIDE
ncbi:spore germination protein [Sporolactobacillus inulinus]|uniref:Spore gernimation protein GerA n=1 Tax=Sporolactobacillus inulinus CASD TaxID=1069536 RepID=A0A0U1QPU9_9BACL|nr:spore germination protein [Sporolactobacillus inulinus]KLI02829.1 spore gernimation protein GerA [Sporolactobacillus inulinus CASD]GEB75767.1 spore germination protein [Sporolactobacillus inulinus]